MKEYLRVKRIDGGICARGPDVDSLGLNDMLIVPNYLQLGMISALFNIYKNIQYALVLSNDAKSVFNLLITNLEELGVSIGDVWLKIGYNPIDNAVIDFSDDIKIICANNIGFLKNSVLKLGVELEDVEWFL